MLLWYCYHFDGDAFAKKSIKKTGFSTRATRGAANIFSQQCAIAGKNGKAISSSPAMEQF